MSVIRKIVLLENGEDGRNLGKVELLVKSAPMVFTFSPIKMAKERLNGCFKKPLMGQVKPMTDSILIVTTDKGNFYFKVKKPKKSSIKQP